MSKKKRKKKKHGSQPPAATVIATASGREKLEEKIAGLEQKLEDKKRAAFESSPGEDDASIPPVVEDEFFKKGDAPPRVSAGMSGSFDAVPDPRSQRKLSPEVRARRAQLSKWVKAAVAVSATILAIAALRVSLTRHKEEPPVKVAAALQAPVLDPVVQPPVQTAQEQIQPPPVDPVKDETADSKDPVVVSGSDDSKEQAKDEPKAEAMLNVQKPKTAAQEKAMAQALLDGNNAGGAAAAAQRSVALDPHDAEAWLFLGAAYQMQGNNGAAKQAFTNCTTHAKRGPIGECTSMLNQ